MTREEALKIAKPILFNTEMVRAILYGRKTVTRRIIKHDIDAILNSPYHKEHPEVSDKQIISKLCMPPYAAGDILYVRETWSPVFVVPRRYLYKAGCKEAENIQIKWHPSIHMPKEAARIFLRVKGVRVERLQEITWQEAAKEGCYGSTSDEPDPLFHIPTLKGEFWRLWNSTIKKQDLDKYGWDANPWVWVIEFERIEVE